MPSIQDLPLCLVIFVVTFLLLRNFPLFATLECLAPRTLDGPNPCNFPTNYFDSSHLRPMFLLESVGLLLVPFLVSGQGFAPFSVLGSGLDTLSTVTLVFEQLLAVGSRFPAPS